MAVETAVEHPLIDPRTGEDLGVPLVGVLDLVLAENSGSLIVDFNGRLCDQLSELSHEIQLGGYAYLFRQTTGMDESGFLEIRRLVKTKMPQVSFHRWPARTGNHFGRLFAVITCIHTGLRFALARPAAIATSGNGTAASGRDEIQSVVGSALPHNSRLEQHSSMFNPPKCLAGLISSPTAAL